MHWTIIKVIIYSVVLKQAVFAQHGSDESDSLQSEDNPRTESIITEQETLIDSESSKIYGETNAERFGDISVVDLIFRKRRQITNCEDKQTHVDEAKLPDSPKSNDEVVSVEEIELVSYEEISNADDKEPIIESRSNTPNVMEYLTPPAPDANCTYDQNDESTTAGIVTEIYEEQSLVQALPENIETYTP